MSGSGNPHIYSLLSEARQFVIQFKDLPAFLRYNGLFQEKRHACLCPSAYTAHLHAQIPHKQFRTIKQEFRFNFLTFLLSSKVNNFRLQRIFLHWTTVTSTDLCLQVHRSLQHIP